MAKWIKLASGETSDGSGSVLAEFFRDIAGIHPELAYCRIFGAEVSGEKAFCLINDSVYRLSELVEILRGIIQVDWADFALTPTAIDLIWTLNYPVLIEGANFFVRVIDGGLVEAFIPEERFRPALMRSLPWASKEFGNLREFDFPR